ncbi:hypothetical protein Glove_166g153 [Diversispora epigaea]|uniref:mRNA 3'-end-processing protein n=1 Tax=Diversispora epigaea TaxID=1348612 RepID=A0A397IYN9_9GLOM|nr:hypothetical protein Glove_166g153 [Diversispora epigaea]
MGDLKKERETMIVEELKSIFSNDKSNIKFDFEGFVKTELGLALDKTPKSQQQQQRKQQIYNDNNEVCQDFLRGICKRGSFCRYVHSTKKLVVCKHWLRGLCMKGDEQCEFLHEYNLKKVPKCIYYMLFGECITPDCIYSHEDEICDDYLQGFCFKGPGCNKKHLKKVACSFFVSGICSRGYRCPEFHPPSITSSSKKNYSKFRSQYRHRNSTVICYRILSSFYLKFPKLLKDLLSADSYTLQFASPYWLKNRGGNCSSITYFTYLIFRLPPGDVETNERDIFKPKPLPPNRDGKLPCQNNDQQNYTNTANYSQNGKPTNEDRETFYEVHLMETTVVPDGIQKSYYRDFAIEICNQVGQRKANTPMMIMGRFESLKPGYYGTRGMNIITEILKILVPETALRLISQDMGGITLEEAKKIMEDSSVFGDYVNAE